MLSVKIRAPMDYRLCNQTVTLYHWDGRETITRQVITNAFLDFRKNQSINKTGSTEVNSFLLVIPCTENPLAVGDKVFHGVGPDISTVEQWRKFIPVTGPVLVVKYIDPKYWKGRMIHVEAGG